MLIRYLKCMCLCSTFTWWQFSAFPTQIWRNNSTDTWAPSFG